jgi:alpha,alpha-trehalose-phosphate synthase [UDP-forming]/trehalose-phosphatase
VTEQEHWLSVARSPSLGVLTDLDGTLIPFAATPDAARPKPDVRKLLRDLAGTPGTVVAVVSGRPRDVLETYFADCPGLLLVAEHGGWRRDDGGWQPAIESATDEVESLTRMLGGIADRYPGALVERKTWSVAFHFRAISPVERNAAVVEVDSIIGTWLAHHRSFALLRGAKVLEVRPAPMVKGRAVAWLRDHLAPGARLVALGDDVTDEDTFVELGAEDESIVVSNEEARATAARWRLAGVGEVKAFLRWIGGVRRESGNGEARTVQLPRRIQHGGSDPGEAPFRLLVVSNRLPEIRSSADFAETRKRTAGGLVAALEPVLAARRGVWLGWSGNTSPRADASAFNLDDSIRTALASVDFPDAWYERYYRGMCNSALWPLLHSFPDRATLAKEDWQAYWEANDAFAAAAARLVRPGDPVWVHDYHLLLLGQRLRERNHHGPLGLFVHVPFPGPDIWFILPWASELLTAILAFDLVGFHTPGFAGNFLACAATVPGVTVRGDTVEYRGRATRVRAFPLGIVPPGGSDEPPEPAAREEIDSLARALGPTRLVLGVDRLDYTTGIPERLEGFARLLAGWPEWRKQVSLVQISVPARSDAADYVEQRERVESIVAQTNAEYGDEDWVPIRYLYRSFGRAQLSLLYRTAAVGFVAPLRDGMNLVAKEFVAAQDPDDPGVLLLSRFAGAAHELLDAVITNPWHVDGLAEDLDRALRMKRDERRNRHRRLAATVSRSTAVTWAEDFLAALTSPG